MKIKANFKNAIRNLGRHGQHNIIKILCLGVGLAVGCVIIAKVYFEQSYDTFFPNIDRTYLIKEVAIQNGQLQEYPQTSGAIAQGMKRYAPQIEAATRYTYISEKTSCETEDKKKININSIVLADSCFFDVLQRPILMGNAKDVLSRAGYCMINEKLAKKIGLKAVGSKIFFPQLNLSAIVGGIYKDIPENSYMKNLDVIGSLASYDKRSTENWVGNDRYLSYIRLTPEAKISDLTPIIKKMMQENMPLDEMAKAGVKLNYSFIPVTKLHTDSPTVKRMTWILALLAFILIFSAIMNYLLIVIGNMINRSKEMAIHKCYGAENRNIHGIIFTEGVVHLFFAIILAGLLIFVCKGSIEDLLDAPLSALLFNKGSWIWIVLCLLILLITGFLPGILYSQIPVSVAFRGYTENRRRWKLILLAIQFTAAGFLFSLLFIISRQYNRMINDNPGYQYNNLAYIDMSGTKSDERTKVLTELRKSARIENVTAADCLPIDECSGNNISLPNDDRELFNGADLYSVTDDYLKTMSIHLIEGKNFTEQTDSLREVLVSPSFVEKMKIVAHWENNVIGKEVLISEHSQDSNHAFTICGVYNDIRIGSISNPELRPTFMFYTKHTPDKILIKFHELTPEAISEVQNTIKNLFPDKDFHVENYRSKMTDLYTDSLKFRNAVMISGFVTIIIALIGLIGYSNDEVNRRRKEIAIRKVNGAQATDIMTLFMRDILRIALPSLIIGGTSAAYVALKWQQQFVEKVPLNTFLFIGCGIAILAIILVTINFNCYKIANSNPVNYLKGE